MERLGASVGDDDDDIEFTWTDCLPPCLSLAVNARETADEEAANWEESKERLEIINYNKIAIFRRINSESKVFC